MARVSPSSPRRRPARCGARLRLAAVEVGAVRVRGQALLPARSSASIGRTSVWKASWSWRFASSTSPAACAVAQRPVVHEQRPGERLLERHDRADHGRDLGLDVVALVEHVDDPVRGRRAPRVRRRRASRRPARGRSGTAGTGRCCRPSGRRRRTSCRSGRTPRGGPPGAGSRRSARCSRPSRGGRCRRRPGPARRGAGRPTATGPSPAHRCGRTPARRACTRAASGRSRGSAA